MKCFQLQVHDYQICGVVGSEELALAVLTTDGHSLILLSCHWKVEHVNFPSE